MPTSRTSPAVVGEAVAFAIGTAEELGEHGARDVEPFGGDVVHLRVLLHAHARERLDTRAEPAGRIDERGQREQRQQRHAPVELEHDHERHDELDEVLQHGAERGRDGLLRADDIVVESRLQRAGLRAREERDRHLLHVVEELDAQVVDEAFTDARRVVPLHEREHRVGEREPDRGERDPRDQRLAVFSGIAVSRSALNSSGGIAVATDARITAMMKSDELDAGTAGCSGGRAASRRGRSALPDRLVAPKAHHRAVVHHSGR